MCIKSVIPKNTSKNVFDMAVLKNMVASASFFGAFAYYSISFECSFQKRHMNHLA